MGLFRRNGHGGTAGATDTVVAPPEQAETRPRSAVQAGVPGRCSACNGFGYIDHIDMVNRRQTQHCPDCGHKWEFSFDEDGDVIDLTDSALAARAEDSLQR